MDDLLKKHNADNFLENIFPDINSDVLTYKKNENFFELNIKKLTRDFFSSNYLDISNLKHFVSFSNDILPKFNENNSTEFLVTFEDVNSASINILSLEPNKPETCFVFLSYKKQDKMVHRPLGAIQEMEIKINVSAKSPVVKNLIRLNLGSVLQFISDYKTYLLSNLSSEFSDSVKMYALGRFFERNIILSFSDVVINIVNLEDEKIKDILNSYNNKQDELIKDFQDGSVLNFLDKVVKENV